MPNPNVNFQGQTLILPGAYYADNVNAVTPNTPPTTPPLVFIGYGYGCKPQTINQFASAADLLKALRGGPAADLVRFMAQPSPTLNGAQLITFINVGANTQGSVALNASAATGVIQASTVDYGLPSNLMQIVVATGSLVGKQVTVFDGYANITQAADNLGVPFKLAYTGAATGVTYTVTVSGGNATSLSVSSNVSGQSFTVPLGSGGYQTVQQVVAFLNGTGYYSAISLSPNGDLPSNYLDAAAAVSLAVSGSGGYAYTNVTSYLPDIVWFLNKTGMVSGAVRSGVTSSAANVPMNSTYQFSGATSVPPTTSDYATAFNLALTTPGWVVVADSNAAAVQALGAQHAVTASSITYAMYRRFFTGSSIGDSVSGTIVAAQNLGQKECMYFYPGFYNVNPNTGVNTLYPGYYAAAAAAAMACGNPIPLPLTNKPLNGTGVEKPNGVALTVSQINQLQQAGVACLNVPQQTVLPTIVSDLTTWQADSNPENIFSQQIACRQWLAYTIINALSPYVGSIASAPTEMQILNAVKKALNASIYSPGAYGYNGVIASWDPKSLTLVYTGATQLAAIAVNATLVGQNRFITCYTSVQPLNITLTATAQ